MGPAGRTHVVHRVEEDQVGEVTEPLVRQAVVHAGLDRVIETLRYVRCASRCEHLVGDEPLHELIDIAERPGRFNAIGGRQPCRGLSGTGTMGKRHPCQRGRRPWR